MISWRFRSETVPCHRRGYQTSGRMMVRPSTRSTVNEFFLTDTFCALASWISLAKEVIPCLQELVPMLLHHSSNPSQLCPTKTSGSCQRNRVKPVLGGHVLPPDMHMGRFCIVQRHKENSVRSYYLDCWHCPITAGVAKRSQLRILMYLASLGATPPPAPHPTGSDHGPRADSPFRGPPTEPSAGGPGPEKALGPQTSPA